MSNRFNFTNSQSQKTISGSISQPQQIMSDQKEEIRKIPGFEEFIKKILDTLQIDPKSINDIIADMDSKFNRSDKYKILNNPKINELLKADEDLKRLEQKLEPYYNDIKDQWNLMMKNLGKLQTFIFLKKIEPSNCGPIINEIITALNTKINTVNEILEENIKSTNNQAGGNIDSFKQKYLKYKSKYLHIKNNI